MKRKPPSRRAAAAYHRVQAFADHIDDAVVEVQFQLHLRVALLEAGQHRQQEAVADGGQADAQQPTGGVLSLRQVRLRFGKLIQCAATALQQQFAFVGEVHAAGGALEQARAESLFKPGDALAAGRG